MSAVLAILKAVPVWVWAVIGLVVSLAGWALWERDGRKDAVIALAQAQISVEVFRGAYNILSATTVEQNRAVQAMKDEGERRAKEGAAALAKARADGEAWRRSADRMRAILATPMPMTCDEAVQAAKDAL